LTLDPFALTAAQLQRLLDTNETIFPELRAARDSLAALGDSAQAQVVFAQTEPLLHDLDQLPTTSYTLYRQFVRNGERGRYERPYFLKRKRLGAAAIHLFFGRVDLKDAVQDHLWDICEESNWVVPAHEDRIIDLFAAETGFVLAEALALLGDTVDAEVRHRVRLEVERRIFDPYLRFHHLMGWYKGTNNWNGVCNSSVAATFLLLEPERSRTAQALELALAGLGVFLRSAFEEDGSSTEGVAYWHYGLINFVALAEMLRARSGGKVDLLASEHMRRIASYPAKMQLSGSWFASFSDCDERVSFNPGIIQRLAKRTGETSLFNVLAHPARPESDWRLTMMLRNLLWWDGRQNERAQVGDAVLSVGGVAKLVARTSAGAPVIVAAKAGHNDENHNQNDVGSFILHVDGENLLTDPGRGLYSQDYFSPRRYENIFANSYGHSVPRIGGRLQEVGRTSAGELVAVDAAGRSKRIRLEFARAYPLPNLQSATRELTLASEGNASGTVWLQDVFRFSGTPAEVEEALVTWHAATTEGATATIDGTAHRLKLTIEEPQGAAFKLEALEQESSANAKEGTLKRLSFVLPAASEVKARVRMELMP
jgi:hypothetical protein